jgi:hypothetical protein
MHEMRRYYEFRVSSIMGKADRGGLVTQLFLKNILINRPDQHGLGFFQHVSTKKTIKTGKVG